MSALMRNFKFRVTISGEFGGVIGFSSVSGITRETEVIEYREGGEATTMRKFPGQTSFGNITLERGFTTDSDLVKWMDDSFVMGSNVAPGFDARRTVTIEVLNPNAKVQRKLVFSKCFVVSREIGDLDATGNEILIESLEFAHQGYNEHFYGDDGEERNFGP